MTEEYRAVVSFKGAPDPLEQMTCRFVIDSLDSLEKAILHRILNSYHSGSTLRIAICRAEQVRWVMAPFVEAIGHILLTPVLINKAKNVIFMVQGSEKADRLHEVLEGPLQLKPMPSLLIRPVQGRFLWLVDEAAAVCPKRVRRTTSSSGWGINDCPLGFLLRTGKEKRTCNSE